MFSKVVELFLILFFVISVVQTRPKKPTFSKCGYEACSGYVPGTLNVHIIAHSHDDVGWLKTVDQYYYGNKMNIQHAGVRYIIDSVVDALLADPARKFIQVESAFLSKWWSLQNDQRRAQFVELVENGQLEIVGGAWSMNDEAASHYHSLVDQFTVGLRFLNRTLGECGRPKIGWQIDPFGHTREMASIFARLGYDAVFFARLDWRDRLQRLRTKTAEMLWKGSDNEAHDGESLIFTHALYNHYSPPPGFFFDVLSNDDPLISDKSSTEYNIEDKMRKFTEFVYLQSMWFDTDNIVLTMGNDFTFQDAHYSFKNLDVLIQSYRDFVQYDYLNRTINLFYSTPACYLKAVNDYATRTNLTFQVKTDDFIPYASDHNSYWSGYFTSRPTQKRFERQANNLLQVAKQLSVSSNDAKPENSEDLKEAIGVMQHHDAITGTEKQHVAKDYARLVFKAVDNAHVGIRRGIQKLLHKKPNTSSNLTFESCLLSNVSYCEPSSRQSGTFVVAVYNPLSRNVTKHVRLPVNATNFKIVGPEGSEIKWQLLPTIDSFSEVHNITPSLYELVFNAENLPPLGIKVYHVTILKNKKPPQPDTSPNRFFLGAKGGYQVLLNQRQFPNSMLAISNTGKPLEIGQRLMYYVGAQDDNTASYKRSSGAYIFRPDPQYPTAIPLASPSSIRDSSTIYRGALVDELHQKVGPWAKQILRVYHEESYLELDWLVGPIDIDDGRSKEIVSRYDTDLTTGSIFKTDSNGRETILRRNWHRNTYNYTNEEPIAGNYYPVTSFISIADPEKDAELVVLTDRAQGGASLVSGQLELMLHRRLLRDDAFGVSEALNETEFDGRGLVARGRHFLIVTSKETRRERREIAQRKLLSPWVFVADASNTTLESLNQTINFNFSGLVKNLPEDVQVLTLETWGQGKVLLRLENILEAEEGGRDVSVNLSGLFTAFKILDLEEHTLAANQPLQQNEKLKWKADGCLSRDKDDCLQSKNKEKLKEHRDDLENLIVTLAPMQIRTFLAKIVYN